MNFLEGLLQATDEAESPRAFFLWSGIAAISAILRKNVYVNKKIYRVYPNIFVMFIAKSALRKGYPVKIAQKLVEQAEILKVISGQNSIQSIITELGKQWTSEHGKIFREAQAFIVNDELDSLIISDPSAQTLLTTLYDSYLHPKWQKSIKKDGRETLDNLYITMLTATNEDHLEAFLDKTSVKGGFLGRTLLIHEHKLSKINPLIGENETTEINTKPLVDELVRMSNIKGQFNFSREAVAYYNPWYKTFMEKLQEGEIKDDTGTAGRAGDTVLKLAMCLSVNDNDELIINETHIEEAINLFYRSLKDISRFTVGRGKSEIADKNKIVLGFLLAREGYRASKKDILSTFYGDLEVSDLDRVAENLKQAGILVIENDPHEGLVYKVVERYAKKFKGTL